jgi:hypothetical protein
MGGNQNKEHDRIVAEMRKKLEAIGCMTIHLKSYTVRKMGRRILRIPLSIKKGWPDIISFRPDGMVEFYEVKTGDAKLNPYQVKRCDELARRGFRVTIIHGHKAKEVYKWKKKS